MENYSSLSVTVHVPPEEVGEASRLWAPARGADILRPGAQVPFMTVLGLLSAELEGRGSMSLCLSVWRTRSDQSVMLLWCILVTFPLGNREHPVSQTPALHQGVRNTWSASASSPGSFPPKQH